MNKINVVSVAMCTYNGEAFIREQLDSINDQTILPDELVICDDASKDNTLIIIRAFIKSSKFPVKVFVNKKNIGICRNFENAISHCTGDAIVLADQDDKWKSYKIEKIIDAFDENPLCGFIFSNAELIDETGKTLGRDLWKSIGFNQIRYENYISGNQLEVMLKGGNFIYGMTMAFRTTFKSKVLPIKSQSFDCVHDTWICLVLSSINAKGIALPICLVEYRQHTKQLSGGGRSLTLSEVLKSIFTDTSEENLSLAKALQNIAEKLENESQNDAHIANNISKLSDKSKHLRARSFFFVSANTFKEINSIFYEYFTGRYNRFSSGHKSLLKDLISYTLVKIRGQY